MKLSLEVLYSVSEKAERFIIWQDAGPLISIMWNQQNGYARKKGTPLVQNVEVADINGCIEVNYEENVLHTYVMEILTLGLCSFFFKGSFIRSEASLLGTFETKGFRKLSSLNEIGTEDILTIAISILQGAVKGEQHYIFSDEYEIDVNTVFVDKSISAVKVIYLPSAEKTELSAKIGHLLRLLKGRCAEEGRAYLDNAIDFIENSGFNDQSVVHHLENLRREVYLCSIA